jgi:hypothetical protein
MQGLTGCSSLTFQGKIMHHLRRSLVLPFALLGTVPAPVFAQDNAESAPQVEQQPTEPQAEGPVCSGQPARWLGGTAEGSDISTAEEPIRMVLQATDNDNPYVAFRISADTENIRAEAQERNGDPSIILSTMDGRRLARNDDSNGTLSSQVNEYMRRGDYCLQLVPVSGSEVEATMQVSTSDMEPLIAEPEDVRISSCRPTPEMPALFEGDPATGLPNSIQTEGGVDYMRLSLTEETPMSLRAQSTSLDPRMELFDANGQRIAENDDADELNSRLDFPTGLPAGEYCLGVAPVSPGHGVINVSASFLDPATVLAEAYRKGDLPPSSDSDYPMQQLDLKAEKSIVVLSDGNAQWFSFEVDEQSVLVIHAYGSTLGADTRLTLFGSNGATIGTNDDANETTDAQLGPIVLPADTYRMALTDLNNGGDSRTMRPVSLVFETYQKVE